MLRLATALGIGGIALTIGVKAAIAQDVLSANRPPVARVIPTRLEKHGHLRVDNYYWLREQNNPEVLKYLEAENKYYEAVMAHAKPLEEKLYQEMKGRIQETDMSVPEQRDDYLYYTRTQEGKQYPIYCRRSVRPEAAEQVMLDANRLAEGHPYCSVQVGDVSFGQDILPYAVDTVGRRFYTIHFKRLDTGETLADVIPDVTGNMAWANDNRALFYTKQQPETLRSYQVYRHVLATDPRQDPLVYEETDETFHTSVHRTRSKRYIMIASQQTLSSEYRYLDANDPQGEFTVFLSRQRDHEYDVDHYGEQFYIRTNWQAVNFRLMTTPILDTRRERWEDVIGPRDEVFLQGFALFRHHLVVHERKDGLIRLRVRPWSGQEEHEIDFGEPAYAASMHANPDTDTEVLRYGYTSLTTPNSVYDYNMVTREKRLMKQMEVLGGFDPSHYQCQRLHATARDGTRVPVSLVYRRDRYQPGQNPLVLYGYGSYGISMDANFQSARLSLLDRGFVWAMAHVRGGQELGRHWYEAGKLLKKKNTFTDFIDVAEFLVETHYADPQRIYAIGGSAGGLLMGAVVNMRPDLFRGVIAQVPFVDVVTTMLDESIPLTSNEYDEWGNPNHDEYYHYLLSYSPYDNVAAKEYPNLLVTTGLHDSQVQYWEPAKWVAKLRASTTSRNRLLLKVDLGAGHSGPSGRYSRLREEARWFTFLLDLEGTD